MEAVQTSVLCGLFLPLWLRLKEGYEDSGLARCIRGLAALWGKLWAGSVLWRFFRREGVLTKAWPHSILCKFLTFLVNIPTRILQLLYGALKPAFDDSFMAQLAFGVVESAPVAVGWLMLLVMVIPYENWNNAYSFAGFIFCGVLAVFAGMRRKDWRVDLTSVGPWLVAFAGMVMVAWPMSAYRSQSTRFLLFHATCMLCVVILVSCIERRDQLMRVVTWASLALCVMSAAGLVQRIQGVEVNPSYVDQTVNEGMPGRVYAFYDNPNAFGEVLLLLIPLAVALMLCSKGWLGRLVGFFSTALGCVAMAMTYSRAGWVGLAVAAVLFVVLWNRKLIPVGIVAALLGLALLPDTVFHRILTIFNTSDTSTNSRFPYYYAAAEFLKMRPLQGAGLGTDAVRSAISDLNLFHGKDHFVHCHNIYLQVWCETGILGLISFVGGILWTVKEGARAARKALCHRQTRIVVIGGISALLGTMVCGLADYIWNYPRVMLIFWFVAAIALAALRLAGREAKDGIQITD